jgi:hypothetical protein
MIYQVQCQFVPGADIWVAQLTPDSPIYQYKTKSTAEKKAAELQAADTTGRLYRVAELG